MAIASIVIRVAGQVGGDAVRLEYAGGELPIASDGTFGVDLQVPGGTSSIALTSVDGRGRRRTRTIHIDETSMPKATT